MAAGLSAALHTCAIALLVWVSLSSAAPRGKRHEDVVEPSSTSTSSSPADNNPADGPSMSSRLEAFKKLRQDTSTAKKAHKKTYKCYTVSYDLMS